MKPEEAKTRAEMDVTEAEFLPDQRLRVRVGGKSAFITSNFQFIKQGIAILEDDPKEEFPWIYNIAYHRDGDDTNVQNPKKIIGGTSDPVLVCLARRYQEALQHGTVVIGPVPLPSIEQARRETDGQNTE